MLGGFQTVRGKIKQVSNERIVPIVFKTIAYVASVGLRVNSCRYIMGSRRRCRIGTLKGTGSLGEGSALFFLIDFVLRRV